MKYEPYIMYLKVLNGRPLPGIFLFSCFAIAIQLLLCNNCKHKHNHECVQSRPVNTCKAKVVTSNSNMAGSFENDSSDIYLSLVRSSNRSSASTESIFPASSSSAGVSTQKQYAQLANINIPHAEFDANERYHDNPLYVSDSSSNSNSLGKRPMRDSMQQWTHRQAGAVASPCGMLHHDRQAGVAVFPWGMLHRDPAHHSHAPQLRNAHVSANNGFSHSTVPTSNLNSQNTNRSPTSSGSHNVNQNNVFKNKYIRPGRKLCLIIVICGFGILMLASFIPKLFKGKYL